MKRPDQPSLQSRLMVLVLGFAAAVWLGSAWITWRDAQVEIDELLDGHLAQSAALLMVQSQGDHDDVYDTPVLQKYAPQVAFQVFVQGQLITRSGNVTSVPMAPPAEGLHTIQRDDGEPWRVMVMHEAVHDITIFVGEKESSRKAILWAVMRSLLQPLLLALPLFGLALWWSVRKGLAPLHALRALLERRAPQTDVPIPVDGMPRELRPLVETLNALLERITHMVQSERRFTADAAHELRTPIAAIRAQAQVALGAGDNVPERTHALQTTLAGCDRASRLVDQLLTLARLEASPTADVTPVDLSALLRRVAGELAHSALARHQDVVVLADKPCAVAASEVLLGVLVRNLLDNAIRYSPPHAHIEAEARMEAGQTVLQVQDSGPGMSQDAIAHLGERFFRVLGNDQPGSGLGWSIVQRVLVVMGAQAEIVRSTEWGGLSVTVRWPARP